LNRKQDELNKSSSSMTDIVRQSREQELYAYYQRLQSYQQKAQED
jgi:hypothetical protein